MTDNRFGIIITAILIALFLVLVWNGKDTDAADLRLVAAECGGFKKISKINVALLSTYTCMDGRSGDLYSLRLRANERARRRKGR